MLDSSPIESQIDLAFPDNTARQIKPSGIRIFLKTLVRWVRDAVNNNLTTWVRSSDGQPGGANTDSVYRVGLTEFRGGVISKVLAPAATPMSSVPSNKSALQVVGSGDGGAAFIEFYVPGVDFQQFGVDRDGKLKYRPQTGAALEVVVDKLTPLFRLASIVSNKKIALYDIFNNEHQFFGLGVTTGALRYQISSITDAHIFYAGTSANSSIELARIQGNGLSDFVGSNRVKGVALPTSGAGLEMHYGISAANSGSIICYDRSGLVYRDLYIDGASILFNASNKGKVGIGTAPTSTLHIKGENGYDQFRLENKYTPSGPNDPNGQPGTYAWDDTWFYLKTTVGWRRMQLQSW